MRRYVTKPENHPRPNGNNGGGRTGQTDAQKEAFLKQFYEALLQGNSRKLAAKLTGFSLSTIALWAKEAG